MTCLIALYSTEILHYKVWKAASSHVISPASNYQIWIGIIETCERMAAEERKMLSEIDPRSPYPLPIICEQ